MSFKLNLWAFIIDGFKSKFQVYDVILKTTSCNADIKHLLMLFFLDWIVSEYWNLVKEVQLA